MLCRCTRAGVRRNCHLRSGHGMLLLVTEYPDSMTFARVAYYAFSSVSMTFNSLAIAVAFGSLLCTAGIAAPLPAQAVESDSIQRRSVQYRNGDVRIAATLVAPLHAMSMSGVVIVHGSGSSTRDNPWTTAYADALARRGIAVLYPDKRGSGESGGDWREASVRDLAGDASAGLAFLMRQSGVDSAGVGVLAFSQGGYVAALMAAEDRNAAFTAVISGGTASLRDQIVDELVLEAERRNEPLREEDLDRLNDLYGTLFRVARQRGGWERYVEEVAQAKAAGGPLAYAVRTMPLDSTHWALGYLQHMGDFDPMVFWDLVEIPGLFIYGGLDTQVRVDSSIERLRSARSRDHFTIVTAGGNGHALFRDDIVALLAEWIRTRGSS